jgi:imidazole glycerol-phosphate synthase subunit HisH
MAKETVVIIDYGSGNLRSAAKAFEHVIEEAGLDLQVKVSARPQDVLMASRIVLPGQGAFGDCMNGLSELKGMIPALEKSVIEKRTPFLGICVGMQLMASRGLEHGVHAGLGWIPGQVVPWRPQDETLKIPHMGWNELLTASQGSQDNRHFVLRNIQNNEHYYFVHSFVFECEYKHHILGSADYGGMFAAVVGRDNMIGVQFHPEKSQKAGLQLLSDFLGWRP